MQDNVVRKGFRQVPKPTKGELEKENATLGQKLEAQVAQLREAFQISSQVLGNVMNGSRSLQLEVDAMSNLIGAEISSAGIDQGDSALIDFLGVLLNEDESPETHPKDDTLPNYFEGGYSRNFLLQNVGSGTLIPGFESALLGRKAGETLELTAQFPVEYKPNPAFASKKVKFLVHVHRVYKAFTPSPVVQTKMAQMAKLAAIAEAEKAAAPSEPKSE